MQALFRLAMSDNIKIPPADQQTSLPAHGHHARPSRTGDVSPEGEDRNYHHNFTSN